MILPGQAPWLSELETELFSFPGSRYDDQVDSVVQALAYEPQEEGGLMWAKIWTAPKLNQRLVLFVTMDVAQAMGRGDLWAKETAVYLYSFTRAFGHKPWFREASGPVSAAYEVGADPRPSAPGGCCAPRQMDARSPSRCSDIAVARRFDEFDFMALGAHTKDSGNELIDAIRSLYDVVRRRQQKLRHRYREHTHPSRRPY